MKNMIFSTALVAITVVLLTAINQYRIIDLQRETIEAQRVQLANIVQSCGISGNLDRAYRQELEDMRYLLGLQTFNPQIDYVKQEHEAEMLLKGGSNEVAALGGFRGTGGPTGRPAAPESRGVKARPRQVHDGDRVQSRSSHGTVPSAAEIVQEGFLAPVHRWTKAFEQ
jgi:hypothetical protein